MRRSVRQTASNMHAVIDKKEHKNNNNHDDQSLMGCVVSSSYCTTRVSMFQ